MKDTQRRAELPQPNTAKISWSPENSQICEPNTHFLLFADVVGCCIALLLYSITSSASPQLIIASTTVPSDIGGSALTQILQATCPADFQVKPNVACILETMDAQEER